MVVMRILAMVVVLGMGCGGSSDSLEGLWDLEMAVCDPGDVEITYSGSIETLEISGSSVTACLTTSGCKSCLSVPIGDTMIGPASGVATCTPSLCTHEYQSHAEGMGTQDITAACPSEITWSTALPYVRDGSSLTVTLPNGCVVKYGR